MSSRPWLQIAITREGSALRAKAQGSGGENPASHILPDLTVEQLEAFGEQVRQAAERGEGLGDAMWQAQLIHQALFQANLGAVHQRQRGGEAPLPVLLRFKLDTDRLLQAVPWEALCEPERTSEFLGSSTDVHVARDVTSNERSQFREVKSAVRVLAVALPGGGAVTRLRAALEKPIQAGEVEFEALVGNQARLRSLIDRLALEPTPHVIHFVGHGRVGESGHPQLQVLDDDGNETWIGAETLARLLRRFCRKTLRLVVLDACEGARPGALASSAEVIAREASAAVIAWLWPVRADITQYCAEAFYRSLTRESALEGDVAVSLNDARMTMLARGNNTAEAFSPVLYLRGDSSVLFDFRNRRVLKPLPPLPNPFRVREPSPALDKLLRKPFTLVLGDRWSNERGMLDGFRKRLRQALTQKVGEVPDSISMSALTQYYAQHFEEHRLNIEFQQVFRNTATSEPLVDELARRMAPGVHVTLMRFPLLELAIAEHQPDVTVHVITPPGRDGGRVTLLRREGGAREWTTVDPDPRLTSLNPENDIIVLHLFCGYLPSSIYMRPLLTEDDYLLGVSELESMLIGESGDQFSPDLVNELVACLTSRPALILGMSMLTWHHRMLLYRIFGKVPLPTGSLVILEPGEMERELWERGRSLPARMGVQVLELDASEVVLPTSPDARRESA
ncbi:CHAT domain-containing protein [Pyxidicoccus xibeiensis]|uniref:CHAT domain-containing protein n=1 Tax=Pyxidicoccus xibeiensis TaxID=2906759 RepID=UPI0020A7A269|nr:CHAT domain-containing protein [Pyxidicoccus xibeiensis]MCP3142236.1 CHAT domain-containing protein [Pyxidicoccus xibeiensis]